MADFCLERIEILGPTLASLIHRASSSPCDVDGLIFGQIDRIVSANLSDDSPADSFASSFSSDQIVATVTSFTCSGKTVSFYDPLGRVDSRRIDSLRVDSPGRLLGWFSARRKTANRPSMRELAVTLSLSSQFQLPIEDSRNPNSTNMASCVFFLLTTPSSDQCIHTHEYRAYQFRSLQQRLEPRSVGIVNIGPAFRGHYGSFSPKSRFPLLICGMSSSAMRVDHDEGSLSGKKQLLKDQKEIDALAEGLQVGNLKRLVGVEAANYMDGMEEFYERMLAKVDSLALAAEKARRKRKRTGGLSSIPSGPSSLAIPNHIEFNFDDEANRFVNDRRACGEFLYSVRNTDYPVPELDDLEEKDTFLNYARTSIRSEALLNQLIADYQDKLLAARDEAAHARDDEHLKAELERALNENRVLKSTIVDLTNRVEQLEKDNATTIASLKSDLTSRVEEHNGLKIRYNKLRRSNDTLKADHKKLCASIEPISARLERLHLRLVYLEQVKEPSALLDQVRGTLNCLKFLKDEGTEVPQDILDMMEEDLKTYELQVKEVAAVELEAGDLAPIRAELPEDQAE